LLPKAGYTELPINTIDNKELLMQFKVMKSLGYKSLFDPGFRREMRNPVRRFLYYKLIVSEENESRKFNSELLKSMTDRLSFFIEPELYRKLKDEESKLEMKDPDTSKQLVSKHEKVMRDYERSRLSESDKKAISKILKRS